MNHRLRWLLVCTAVTGCFNPTGSVFTSSSTDPWNASTSSDASSGSTGANSTGAPPGSTSNVAGTSTSSTGPVSTTSTTGAGVCGDGHVDDGEECDDGPLADGCSSSCKPYRTVFVTSQVFTGDLGGLAGADAKCQAAAIAAELPGTYRAWLSSSTESTKDRLVHSSIPYRLLDGTEIAGNWVDLTDGSLDAGINVSENKSPPGKGTHSCIPSSLPIVWTSTTDSGAAVAGEYFCDDWSGTTGDGSAGAAGFADSTWTSNCLPKCGDEAALYCVEQ